MNNEQGTKVQTPRRWWSRLLRIGAWVIGIVLVLFVARGFYAFRDRNPGYKVDVDISPRTSQAEMRPFQAGFGRVKINPDISDPKRPVWLAGFSQGRAATGIHDDLWAIACVLDDGWTRVGFVVLDAIGFFNDDVAEVRKRLGSDLRLNYAVVCSTHNHSTPDLMGLWGANWRHSGVDPKYREQVRAACVAALSMAATNLQPARVALHEIATNPKELMSDTRKPEVFDGGIRVMHFVHASSGQTLGSIVGWADHPETVWSRNTEITADFCGYLRDALEKGCELSGSTNLSGLGGIHLYINGCVGGLMSTTPSTCILDPVTNRELKEPSHEKARALGLQVAQRVLREIASNPVPYSDHLPIGARARTINVKLDNKLYLLAGYLGLLDRGYPRWRHLRTEIALLTLGDASIACVPGEMYPEIANGGIEKPVGADYDISPVEVPPLRELMPGKLKFIFGLANDEVGYLVPKSQWDEKPPYTYGTKHGPYGEVNSLGPDAAGTIHSELKKLCTSAQSSQ